MNKESVLRESVHTMTKLQFIQLRDDLEANWDDSYRGLMQVLSLSCINRFRTTLIKLN
jgi:hypothetical protein